MVPGVRAAGFLFFSAIRGEGPDGSMGADTTSQARQAMQNLRLLLEGAGATLKDVVKVTVYFQSLHYREAFHRVWMETFTDTPPARTAMQVADANAFPGGMAHFVLDVIALAPDTNTR
jgi:2-iminobutanoate/2-iminopropanoate deaminase